MLYFNKGCSWRTCGERLLPMLGLTVLVCPVGDTKLSEYPEKPWRPEDRQYAELPSWEPADEPSPPWCTEVGGRGCGRWTVLGCSDAAENKTFYLKSHFGFIQNSFAAVNKIIPDSVSSHLRKSFFLSIHFRHVWVCSAEPTLSYRSGSVGAVGQLIGLQAGHSWRRETTGNEVVKRHQLIGSCLLPPPGSSVAEPHLREKQRQECFMFIYLC